MPTASTTQHGLTQALGLTRSNFGCYYYCSRAPSLPTTGCGHQTQNPPPLWDQQSYLEMPTPRYRRRHYYAPLRLLPISHLFFSTKQAFPTFQAVISHAFFRSRHTWCVLSIRMKLLGDFRSASRTGRCSFHTAHWDSRARSRRRRWSCACDLRPQIFSFRRRVPYNVSPNQSFKPTPLRGAA